MIVDLTYYNKELNAEIDSVIGGKFNLIERMKMKGIGSRRMIIENFSTEFKLAKSNFNDTQYALSLIHI